MCVCGGCVYGVCEVGVSVGLWGGCVYVLRVCGLCIACVCVCVVCVMFVCCL